MEKDIFRRMKRICLQEVQQIINSGIPEKKSGCELNIARALLADAICYEKRHRQLCVMMEAGKKDGKENTECTECVEWGILQKEV